MESREQNKFPRHILGIVVLALLLYWGLHHPSQVLLALSTLVAIIAPLLIGSAIAFIVNVPLRLLERNWGKLWGRATGKTLADELKRPVCLVLSVLIVFGVIFALFFIVVPSLKESITNFVSMVPRHLAMLEGWWKALTDWLSQYGVVLPAFNLDLEKLYNTAINFFTNYGQAVMDTTIGITTSIFSVLVNIVLSFVFSLYLLAQKETLARQVTRLVRAVLSEKRANWLLNVANLANRTFFHFITGQLTEAVILGVLCFVGMTLFRMPYAPVVSVLIGFTALIPIFGAFIGVGIGTFLILLTSPIQAIWFLVFILVLQQVEGNLIYPRVVGKSVGLPGIWVLAAVTVGGNAFGLLGMILSVPVCSVLYALLRQQVSVRLTEKGLDAPPASPQGPESPESQEIPNDPPQA